MTIKFDNVYIKNYSSVACKLEKEGSFGKLYDKAYDDYYIGEKTFEQAEIKMIKDSVNTLTTKDKTSLDKIDVVIGTDLLNQVVANAYSSVSFNKPFIGLYNACSSFCEELIVAGSLLQNKEINNCLCNTSSHNMTAERQFRNPVEYGCPKPKRSTYTVTGATSYLVTNEKTNLKIASVSIGVTTDLGVTDVYDMGSVMAPAAARTIYEHLSETNTTPDDYDMILTGDLGVYGKEILKTYISDTYNINIDEKLEDAGSIIYNREKQADVKAGGSGPVCISLVLSSYIMDLINKNKIKKILLVATGALMNATMNNQKLSIPSIAHAVCLEVI